MQARRASAGLPESQVKLTDIYKEGRIMKKIFYARGSGDETSMEDQLQTLRNALNTEDEVVGEFVDRCASTMARPGLDQALSHAREGGIDAIVVTSLDRLSRSEEQLREIRDFLSMKGSQLQVVSKGSYENC